ncbi:YcfL family protein [Shewanella olleyana]|uniref:YcfL family protein n=1 Tax=Shewanella olleyana TaxID=135626 RepID=UPI00200D050D|nr:YcfL family protein [Shewanella olleyana]MCL1068190.1 YcfL family protein [Shewanella olleyana]
MKYSIVVVTLVLMMSACANHTAGVSAGSNGETRIDNASFASDVAVEQVKVRTQGDLLQGSALILSKVGTDLRLQYKFTWYDVSGYTIEDEATSWKSLKLHGMQQMQVSAVAPNANATRFEVYVRKAFSN